MGFIQIQSSCNICSNGSLVNKFEDDLEELKICKMVNLKYNQEIEKIEREGKHNRDKIYDFIFAEKKKG